MKENTKTILLVLLCFMIALIISLPFIIRDFEFNSACKKLGGHLDMDSRCYKENDNGEMVEYKVRLIGGEFKLVRK